jgi:hypothetical protein
LQSPAFIRFVTRRSQLLSRFDALRLQIDDWIANKSETPSMADLAMLQGLLLDRAKVLTELIANDDHVMELLLEAN